VAVLHYKFTRKQYIEQHNRKKQHIEQHNSLEKIKKGADGAPSKRGTPWCLIITEEKEQKNQNQGSRKMSVGTMKAEYTEQSIHNNNNKNT